VFIAVNYPTWHFAMPQRLGAPRETNPALTRRAQVFSEENMPAIIRTSFLTLRTASSFLSIRRWVKHACGHHDPDRQEKAYCAKENCHDKRIAC
jgi:hypothetical protein